CLESQTATSTGIGTSRIDSGPAHYTLRDATRGISVRPHAESASQYGLDFGMGADAAEREWRKALFGHRGDLGCFAGPVSIYLAARGSGAHIRGNGGGGSTCANAADIYSFCRANFCDDRCSMVPSLSQAEGTLCAEWRRDGGGYRRHALLHPLARLPPAQRGSDVSGQGCCLSRFTSGGWTDAEHLRIRRLPPRVRQEGFRRWPC